MKLYFSCPMTGHADFNHWVIEQAVADLRERGHEVINPLELDGEYDPGWAEAVARDVHLILTDLDLDAVVVYPGWHESRGCNNEVMAARTRGLPVFQYPDLQPLSVWPTWVEADEPLWLVPA